MNVRCPACGAAVALAVGDTRLSCATCGLAAPVSRIGTAPGAAVVALEHDLAGTRIGGHDVFERIGAGGMGTVYRGRGPAGEVAIKVLRPGLGDDRRVALARFAREAQALRRLDHPRVVRFLDHGEDGDVAYIVTELVAGRDLSARLAAGRMALPEIVDVFGQVCDGVAAAHAAGIVHRDLKPANILVGDAGVKVADFGLAQLGPDVVMTTLTRTNVAMGTFHYLAPEQRKDARTVDHRADVWALGVILYEMLTGELPLGSFAPPADRRADAIVRRALAPDPEARFATVAELGVAVRALARPPARRRLVAALAIAGVLGAGAGGVTLARSLGNRSAGAATGAAPIASIDGAAPVDAATSDAGADAGAEAPLDAAVDATVDAASRPGRGIGKKRPTRKPGKVKGKEPDELPTVPKPDR